MRRIVLSFALTIALAFLLTLSAVPAFAATASTHTHARPYCTPQHGTSPRGCYGCNAVQKGYNQTSLGGYTLEVYLFIGYDSNWNYCGWDESVAWLYQPPNKPVGTIHDYACGNACYGLSVNVTPRGTGTWWYDGEPASFPAANQCASAYAVYESLYTSIGCVLP